MEGIDNFMAEMLEEFNYDKDTVMVTTAFAQALANEWAKKILSKNIISKDTLCSEIGCNNNAERVVYYESWYACEKH